MSLTSQAAPEKHVPSSPLDLPRPTFVQMIFRALLRGLIGGTLFSLAFVTLVGVIRLASGEPITVYGMTHLGGMTAVIGFFLFFFLGILSQSRTLRDRAFTVTGFVATFFGLAMLVVFFSGLLTDVAHWFYYQPLMVEQVNWVTLKNQKEFEDAQIVYTQKRAEVFSFLEQDLAEKEKDDKAGRQKILDDYLGTGGAINDKGVVFHPAVEKETAKLKAQAIAEQKNAKSIAEKIEIRNRYTQLLYTVGGVWAYTLFTEETTLAERQEIANRPLRSTDVGSLLNHFLWETPDPAPEAVGIRPALFGSLWIAFIMIIVAVPIGVGAALYLEEYRTEGRLAKLIQVNINNLAGVPSIVFGILGAFVFVELIFKPIHLMNHNISVRNLIGGGLTLALLTLPVVIVSAQEAIRAVPISLRQGGYALGATQWQVIRYQVLPMARPGILTGTILSVSRAIGEAAPLVLFGATTFVAYNPSPITDFTVLPIQIYNWAERSTNPTIDRVAGVTADNGVHIFEALSGRTLARLRGHEGGATAVSFNYNGQTLVTGGVDKTVRVWDAHTFRELDKHDKHQGSVSAVAIYHSTQRQWLLSGDGYGKAVLSKGELGSFDILEGHTAGVTCVAFSPDGKQAVTGSADKTLILWDTQTAKPLVTFKKHTGPVTAVRFIPGSTLLSASQDGTVRHWSDKGVELKVLQGGHKGAVNGVAYAETVNLKSVITGGADKKVLSWDLVTGKVVQPLPEHADEVTGVDIINRSINGNEFLAVVSGSKDQTLRYSELATGKEMQTMQGRYGAVLSLSFDPAGISINAWHNNMALASLVLLVVLLFLNAIAIVLRNRAQQRVRV